MRKTRFIANDRCYHLISRLYPPAVRLLAKRGAMRVGEGQTDPSDSAFDIRALLQLFGFIINPKSFKTNMYIDGVKQ